MTETKTTKNGLGNSDEISMKGKKSTFFFFSAKLLILGTSKTNSCIDEEASASYPGGDALQALAGEVRELLLESRNLLQLFSRATLVAAVERLVSAYRQR